MIPSKYGRHLTAAERQRLYRLRNEGKITSDMGENEILRILDEYPARQKAGRVKVPWKLRARLKELYNLTPKQLLGFCEEQQKTIIERCYAHKKPPGPAEKDRRTDNAVSSNASASDARHSMRFLQTLSQERASPYDDKQRAVGQKINSVKRRRKH